MCRQYVERCGKLGREPDEALLGPIATVMQEMKEGSAQRKKRLVRGWPERRVTRCAAMRMATTIATIWIAV